MTRRTIFLVVYKIVFALLGFSAVITEIAILMERGAFRPANFFSFFTVETNLFVTAMLLASAVATARYGAGRLGALRGAATVYILIVGIGFAVLLSGLSGVALTAVPWDNTVLHYIIPVAVLLDYLMDRPMKCIKFTRGLVWLLVPVIYAAYSLICGALTGWYPYPFLDPRVHGAGAVAVTIVGLIVLAVVLLLGVTRLLGRRDGAVYSK